MIEKVNPSHPDKVADRIAGALVDYAYTQQQNPKCAFEVLIGHNKCLVIGETSVDIPLDFVSKAVCRISGSGAIEVEYRQVPQDRHLADNQRAEIRCGDNGIFKGVPLSDEEKELSRIVRAWYAKCPYDDKFILTDTSFIACQSHASDLEDFELPKNRVVMFNPLGEWDGGVNVDSGATNRKLGSDMGRAVTGGGLHGKDLSKADVAINIYAHLKAQEEGREINLSCAIGDRTVDGKSYGEIVHIAKQFIENLGGFEKLAEWGLF